MSVMNNSVASTLANRAITADSAPQTVNPFAARPDSYGAAPKSRSYDLDIRHPLVPTVVTDKDGNKSAGNKLVSVKSLHGMMFRTLNSVPGATPRENSFDFSSGAKVDVTWTVNNKPMRLTMRVAYVIADESKQADRAHVVFAVAQADGSYKPWAIRVCNMVRVAGEK